MGSPGVNDIRAILSRHFQLARAVFFVRIAHSRICLLHTGMCTMLRLSEKRWHWSCLWAVLSAVIFLAAARLPFLQTIELKTLDFRFRAFPSPQRARTDIVVIVIDEESVQKLQSILGRWPWPRDAYALMPLRRTASRETRGRSSFRRGHREGWERLSGRCISSPKRWGRYRCPARRMAGTTGGQSSTTATSV